ncbi:hypothetical protein BBK82_25175 [Lentzea guizhouensis]|uniref:VWFA domain-containing protein n=1 Tax=Lentzea guizhouensis TaxID=1586287 RepID=A0A1B2HME6_9PSEU|nr:VWA domain-containing protein [Lentzea guizhouensis]ANZ38871.1 hypothetical protein BBK82_25175 [Lentzea guizhouensis]
MRALALAVVALLVLPVPVVHAQQAEPEPFTIGFTRNVDGDNREVMAVDSNAQNLANLTNNERYQQEPAFSFDGTKLAYVDDERVVVANADGTNPRRLTTDDRRQEHPAWSPDGTMIALVTWYPQGDGRVPVVEVYRVADGARVGQIEVPDHLEGSDTQPDWSPDGTTIALVRRARHAVPPQLGSPRTDRPARLGSSFDLAQVVKTPRIPPKPDIVLLIDVSRSMDDELAGVQRTLAEIVEEVGTAQPETQFGLASFAGHDNGDRMFYRHSELTKNLGNAVNDITLVPNQNSEEVWAHALIRVATGEFDFRPDSSRVVVLIGDEPTVEHEPEQDDTVDAAIKALQEQNIKTVAVDSGGINATGQVTRVIRDPKGALKTFDENGSAEISEAILDGIGDLEVKITPVPSCDEGLSVELDPAGPVTAPSGQDVRFAERFTVAGTAVPGSTLRCTIEFRLNNEQEAPPAYTQVVTVRVAGSAQPVVLVEDVTAQARDDGGALVRYEVSAVDREGRPLVPACVPPSGTFFPAGVTTVRCTATDARGNTGTDTAIVTVVSAEELGSRIWLVTPDGSTQVDLSARFAEPCSGSNDEDPAWSPDGTRLAFTHDDERICTVAADGSGAVTVVQDGEVVEWPRNPAWLPDGTRLLFDAADSEAEPDLWRVAAQGGTPELFLAGGSEPAVRRLPKITVTATAAPAQIAFGGTTTLEFTVTNTGYAPAPVTLTVTLPAGLQGQPIGGPVGSVAAGETRTVRGEARGVVAGDHAVTATTGSSTATVTVKVAEEVKPPDTPGSLSLAVGASPQPGFVGGDAVEVTFRLRNGSGTPMTDVRLIASAFGCQPDCVVGTVAPGAEAEVKLAVPTTAAVDVDLAGVLTATGPDTDAADNVASTRVVVKQPALTMDQQAGPLGGVVSVQGKDFPPGARVRLAWSVGISETPGELTTADGTFSAQMLVFHNDTEGTRQALATSVGGTRFGEVKAADFLAWPSTVQPAGFVERG